MTRPKVKGPKPQPGAPRFACPEARCHRSFSKNAIMIRHRVMVHGFIPPKPEEVRHRTQRPKSIADPKRPVLIARVSGGENYLTVSREIGVAASTAYQWVNAAIDAGELEPPNEGLVPVKRLNRQKAVALRSLLSDPEMTLKEAAEVLHISYATAGNYKAKWVAEEKLKEAETQAEEEANPEPISYEELTPWARKTLDNFALFRVRILGREWNPAWAIEGAEVLLGLYRSDDDEYVVFNAPPGVGKSTLITHDFECWVVTLERAMGLEPTTLLGHRSMSRSQWYVKRVRSTLEYNRALITNYGRFRSRDRALPWSQDEVTIELLEGVIRNEKEPTISSGSYDAALLSGRFKLNIWDDLIDKGNSAKVEQREALTAWWEQEAETRMEPGGLTILSNARWGPEDLSYSVRQVADAEELDAETGQPVPIYKHVTFKAHYQELCDGTHHKGNYPEGCLLDEKRLNWRRMRKARQNTNRFELVYQQEDIDPAGFLAQRVWFDGGMDSHGALVPGCFHPELQFGQLPEGRTGDNRPLVSVVTIDPSSTKMWSVNHFLGWPDKTHLLYKCERRPFQAPEILYLGDIKGTYTGVLEDFWQSANDAGVPFQYLIVENNHAQRWLTQYPFFTEWMMARGVSLIPHGTNRSNKPDPERGVEMLGPIYRTGQLWLPYGGYDEKIKADQFRREACSWPEGQYTDMVMGHWFFTFRMENLMGTEQALAAGDQDDFGGAPSWADHGVPRFVRKRYSLHGRESLSA